MADVDKEFAPIQHDLTPDGDVAGLPPDGPLNATPIREDLSTDDGTALDEMFWPNPDAVDLTPRIELHRNAELNETTSRTVTTRMVSTVVTAQPGWDPFCLFPADPNRAELYVRCTDNTDTIGTAASTPLVQPYVIADEKSHCFNGASAAAYLYTTDGPFRSTRHTGAVWIYIPLTATHAVRVQGLSVTR